MQQEDFDFKQIGSRLMAIRKHKSLSRNQLADVLGLKSGRYYGQIESGHAKVTVYQLLLLHDKLEASPLYILLGRGEMFLKQAEQHTEEKLKGTNEPMTPEQEKQLNDSTSVGLENKAIIEELMKRIERLDAEMKQMKEEKSSSK